MKNKQVSFDYDGTLTNKEVQEYCKELISKGYEIFITTYRYNNMLKHIWVNNPDNSDLYKTCDELGIPHSNVVFTNFKNKGPYIFASKVLFHLDDCEIQIEDISEYSDRGILYNSKENWKEKCEDKLKN